MPLISFLITTYHINRVVRFKSFTYHLAYNSCRTVETNKRWWTGVSFLLQNLCPSHGTQRTVVLYHLMKSSNHLCVAVFLSDRPITYSCILGFVHCIPFISIRLRSPSFYQLTQRFQITNAKPNHSVRIGGRCQRVEWRRTVRRTCSLMRAIHYNWAASLVSP